MKIRHRDRANIRSLEESDDDLFRSLVSNALEFLETASVQIKQSPKQSLVNFAAGLELFLKARLLREHWTLILEKPGQGKLENLRRGDFKSVSPMEAVERLQNIVGLAFNSYEKRAFQDLIEQRNKAIHFFNTSYTRKKEDAIRKVMVEQLRAWFYLHRLLTVQWEADFFSFKKEILAIDRRLRKNGAYLEGKYHALLPEITAEKNEGKVFTKCAVCSFEASRLENLHEPLFQHKCLVCNTIMKFLLVPCPKCDNNIIVEDLGEGECTTCGHKVSLTDLLKMYRGYRDPKEYNGEIYCSECSNESIVEHREGYLCLSCLSQFNDTALCEWCTTEIAGFNPAQSYFLGCVACDGRYDNDD